MRSANGTLSATIEKWEATADTRSELVRNADAAWGTAVEKWEASAGTRAELVRDLDALAEQAAEATRSSARELSAAAERMNEAKEANGAGAKEVE